MVVPTTTSNSLRAASSGTPPRPFLWVWVEGQTRMRLSWSARHSFTPTIESPIQVCAEAEADDSVRHYRVASRNANGLGEFSRVRSATTELRPMAAECATAVWSAYVTVATFGAYDDQGYRGGQLDGALTEDAAGTTR